MLGLAREGLARLESLEFAVEGDSLMLEQRPEVEAVEGHEKKHTSGQRALRKSRGYLAQGWNAAAPGLRLDRTQEESLAVIWLCVCLLQ